MPRRPRSVTAILDELADVERYLVDAPPHAGAGHRDHLIRRAAELRRELAEVRRQSSRPDLSTDTNDSISP